MGPLIILMDFLLKRIGANIAWPDRPLDSHHLSTGQPIVTVRQGRCGKVMFLVVSVRHSVHQGFPCDHYPWCIETNHARITVAAPRTWDLTVQGSMASAPPPPPTMRPHCTGTPLSRHNQFCSWWSAQDWQTGGSHPKRVLSCTWYIHFGPLREIYGEPFTYYLGGPIDNTTTYVSPNWHVFWRESYEKRGRIQYFPERGSCGRPRFNEHWGLNLFLTFFYRNPGASPAPVSHPHQKLL